MPKCGCIRGADVVFEGEMASLRHEKEDVREIRTGFECGVGFKSFHDIQVGDVLVCYIMEKSSIHNRDERIVPNMPSEVRLQRIADRIRQELSDMLLRDISDPRLKLIFMSRMSRWTGNWPSPISLFRPWKAARVPGNPGWTRIRQRFHPPQAGARVELARLPASAFSLGSHAGERRPHRESPGGDPEQESATIHVT